MNICIFREILFGAASEFEILPLNVECELTVQRWLSINGGKQERILCQG